MTSAYVSAKLRRQVREDAGTRCGYCRSSEALTGAPLHIDHILPIALGGQTIRENLWLACYRCNEFKGDRTHAVDPETNETVALFNPRTQGWREHFDWSMDGTRIVGQTPCSRATVVALRLNNDYMVEARRYWVEAGWHPPEE
ncbi:MAG TPA: HNH endonuclease [Anaerolineales bacterium]|nr:HNH endonuclease [Anaerolineales bacterium]